jgi:MFS family permease
VSAILTIFIGIQCSSFSYGQFLAGRAIAGFGNGFTTATVPAWQAECTKAHRRGTLLMITAGAFIAAGLSFSYWMGFAFGWLDPSSAAWRAPIAIQVIFILFTVLLLFWLPESPRWLILTGREDEAINVLSALNDVPREDQQVHQEFLQIKDAVLEMSKGSFSSAFEMGDYRHVHRTFLACLLQVFQQMTGVNLVTQYLALMFMEQYGYSGWVARLIAAGAGTWYVMFGASGMSISMIILTIMLYLNTGSSRIVSTVFLFVYCSFFAIGWQGMAWLYQVEVVPLRIRGPANALSTALNWLVYVERPG